MQVRISARHTEIPDGIKEYIEKKASKLERYFERIQEVQAVIEPVKYNFSVEFIVKSDLFTIQATETSTDLRSAIDQVCHVLERKIKKEKDKIVKVKKHTRDTVRRTVEEEGVVTEQ